MSDEREAAYKACPDTNCDWGAFLRGFQAGAEWQRSQQSAPAGYVMVPVEPTDAMKLAGNDALAQHWGAGDAYRAMLAASRLPVQPVDHIAVPSAPAAQGWIPVSERLPEIATDVLVYGVNHGSASYAVAGLFSGSWESQETEETTRFEPTHWMPLPKCPEVKP